MSGDGFPCVLHFFVSCLGLLSFWICAFMVFDKFGRFSYHYFLRYFFYTLFLILLLRLSCHTHQIVWYWTAGPWESSFSPLSFFSVFFRLNNFYWSISSLLTLSPVISILLLSPLYAFTLVNVFFSFKFLFVASFYLLIIC